MECFTLKLTRCFNVVSVSDFLPCSICSVLNCCVVLHRLAKIEALCICCGRLWITGCCYGVETQRSCSQWKHTH